jgi:hypothetical protein
VDVIDIVTPTLPITNVQKLHQIRQTRFIEKPISNTIEEAEEITLANEYNVKGQVGHVERFNPAFIATKNMIESHVYRNPSFS